MIHKKFTLIKFCRFFARSALVGILAALICCIGIWAFLQAYGGKIINAELEKLKAATGLDISVGYLDVTFLPLPALSLTDLRIKGENFELVAPWSFSRPDFFQLFLGNFLPAELTFLRPFLQIQPGTDLPDFLSQAFFSAGKNDTPEENYAPGFDAAEILGSDCKIRISQFDARIIDAKDARVFIGNLSANLTLQDRCFLSGDLEIGRMGLRDQAGNRYVLRHPSVSGTIDLENLLQGKSSLLFQSGVMLSDIFRDGAIKIDFSSQNGRNLASFFLKGDLLLDSYPEQLALEGDVDFEALNRFLAIKKLNWKFGADSGSLQSIISLPDNLRNFKIDGTFYAHRLSLAQWFGFGRNLCPGLQLSLDNIYDATLRFHLNANALDVPQIAARCNGSLFTGSGGVKSFANPVVFLDLQTEKTNLAQALEESVGVSPLQPWFPYAPLTPMPGEPLKEGETGIGYDINIAAKNLAYGPLTLQQAKLRIYPGKIDKDGLEEVLLNGSANFYGGRLKGDCVLGAPASLPITITGSAESVDAAQLETDLPGWPFNGGTFNASASVISEGKVLDVFLKNLRGTVSATGTRASIKDFIFEKMETGCVLKGAAVMGNSVIFDGDWKISARTREVAASSTLKGKINFNESGADFKNLPWTANLTTREKFFGLSAGLNIKTSGQAGLRTDKNEITFSGATFETDALALTGNLTVDFKKLLLQGKLATKKINYQKLLPLFGISNARPGTEFLPTRAETDLKADADSINFNNLKVKLPNSFIGGHLELPLGREKEQIRFNLTADKLVIPKSSSKTSPKPWDFSFMKAFNAEGTLSLKLLEGWQAQMHSLKALLRLKDGILHISDGEGRFYDGKVKLSGDVNFTNGLLLNVKTGVSAFNLGQAVKDQKMDLAMEGTGFINANLSSSGNSAAALMASLSGACDFLVSNGYWLTLEKSGKPKGEPTRFNKMQASAKIVKGRFTTDDFRLMGPTLNIEGKGYLNLVNRDLDYTLNVNMKGLPDFPLYVYGPFDKPKTRIGAGKLVLNALGSVASGFGKLLGGIGKGFTSIFK